MIGLKGLWHTFGVLSGMNRHLHGVRLAQASELVFDFKAAGDLPITHFRLDGEPWAQPLARGNTGPVRVRPPTFPSAPFQIAPRLSKSLSHANRPLWESSLDDTCICMGSLGIAVA